MQHKTCFLNKNQEIENCKLLEEIQKLVNQSEGNHGVYVDLDVGYIPGKCYLVQRGAPIECLGEGKLSFEPKESSCT